MTSLLYTYIKPSKPNKFYYDQVKTLPGSMQLKIAKFKFDIDAQAFIYGKLLIQTGFKKFNKEFSFYDIEYSKYGKPFVNNSELCFNISHSGNIVICILSSEVEELGIDIEKVRKINTSDFVNIWTSNEQELINDQGIFTFFNLWTKKEAVVKMDGRGIILPLQKFDVSDFSGKLENKNFFLKEIHLNENYIINIASPSPLNDIDLTHIEF